MQFALDNPTDLIINALIVIGWIIAVGGGIFALGYIILLWIRNRHREKVSLNSTLLQIAMPINNEIKIDAAEQMFSAIEAMKRVWSSDRLWFFKAQPSFTFEIVG